MKIIAWIIVYVEVIVQSNQFILFHSHLLAKIQHACSIICHPYIRTPTSHSLAKESIFVKWKEEEMVFKISDKKVRDTVNIWKEVLSQIKTDILACMKIKIWGRNLTLHITLKKNNKLTTLEHGDGDVMLWSVFLKFSL